MSRFLFACFLFSVSGPLAAQTEAAPLEERLQLATGRERFDLLLRLTIEAEEMGDDKVIAWGEEALSLLPSGIEPDAEAELPWEPMHREEVGQKVRECIDRLAPHFRTVMILRELEGLPCTEIAEIVGATHVTVRWRLHRGRKLFLAEWERMERASDLQAGLEGDLDGESNPRGKVPNSPGEGGV